MIKTIAMLLALLVVKARADDSRLHGEWWADDFSNVTTFRPDGTGITYRVSSIGHDGYSYLYSAEPVRGQLHMRYVKDTATNTVEYSIEENVLTLKASTGTTAVYRRTPESAAREDVVGVWKDRESSSLELSPSGKGMFRSIGVLFPVTWQVSPSNTIEITTLSLDDFPACELFQAQVLHDQKHLLVTGNRPSPAVWSQEHKEVQEPSPDQFLKAYKQHPELFREAIMRMTGKGTSNQSIQATH